jgi:hypothetical protein
VEPGRIIIDNMECFENSNAERESERGNWKNVVESDGHAELNAGQK